MWRIGTANRPMQLAIKDWFCNWLFMKLFCEKKVFESPQTPVESGKGQFPALFPWNQDLHRSAHPHEWILTLFCVANCGSHVQCRLFEFLGFCEFPVFGWTSWKDETHVHAKHLKRTTQWYLKWFWEVSQVLAALAWRCTQWFPVFFCVFWAPCCSSVVFLKWHLCFQDFC